MEQVIKTYTRVATNASDNGNKSRSRSLTDPFSASNTRYILKTDAIETGMADHYLIFGIRKTNAWRIKNSYITKDSQI